jgi:hypothetical protein
VTGRPVILWDKYQEELDDVLGQEKRKRLRDGVLPVPRITSGLCVCCRGDAALPDNDYCQASRGGREAGMKRQSIAPTYDHRETGDRFTVETRLNGRQVSVTPTRNPFIYHRLTVGRRDLLRSLLQGQAVVEVLVSGDAAIVDDVMELDADCLTMNSTRRDEWNVQVNDALLSLAGQEGKP